MFFPHGRFTAVTSELEWLRSDMFPDSLGYTPKRCLREGERTWVFCLGLTTWLGFIPDS